MSSSAQPPAPSVPSASTQRVYNSQGIRTEESTVTYHGRQLKKIEQHEKIGKAQRVGRIALGILVGVVGCGVGTVLTFGSQGVVGKKAAGNLLSSGWNGEKELDPTYKTLTDNNGQAVSPSLKRSLPYDPVDKTSNTPTSLLSYANAHKGDIYKTKEGHHYILNKADSCFIFIPNGNYDPATTKICEVVLWDLDSGESIADGKRLTAAARTYMAAYDKIITVQEEMSEKDGKDHNYSVYAIDLKNKMVRGFKSDMIIDAHTGIQKDEDMGFWRGTHIKIESKGDDIWKDLSSFFDDNRTEGKQSLEGEKVQDERAHNTDDDEPPRPPVRVPQQPQAVRQAPTASTWDDDDDDMLSYLQPRPLSSNGPSNTPSSHDIHEIEDDEDD